jgi:hypothetical protein
VSVAIPLYGRCNGTHGHVVAHTVVDDVDADLVRSYRWQISKGYARACFRQDGARRSVALHRLVLGLTWGDGRQVDHINRDRLDNRRENLRLATHAQNMQNHPAHRGGTSPFRGVYWHKGAGKWEASARFDGRNVFLGRFDDEVEAARVAARFRAQHMPFTVEDPALLAVAA